jgi:hypothetical protein
LKRALTTAIEDRLVFTRKAAELLGYKSLDGLLQAARAGRAPAGVRLPNGRYAWRQSALDAFLAGLPAEGPTNAA